MDSCHEGPPLRTFWKEVRGILGAGLGWDLEDPGDGLSQAYHHVVRVTAEVTGLEVPQGLVPRVVASKVLPVVQREVSRQGGCLDNQLAQSALVKLNAMVVQLVGPLDVSPGHPQRGALVRLGAGTDLHGVVGVFQEGGCSVSWPRAPLSRRMSTAQIKGERSGHVE